MILSLTDSTAVLLRIATQYGRVDGDGNTELFIGLRYGFEVPEEEHLAPAKEIIRVTHSKDGLITIDSDSGSVAINYRFTPEMDVQPAEINNPVIKECRALFSMGEASVLRVIAQVISRLVLEGEWGKSTHGDIGHTIPRMAPAWYCDVVGFA